MKTVVIKQNGSNLSQISPVSSCIRIISESAEWKKNVKNVKSLSLNESKKKAELIKEDGFSFVMSLLDGSLINASSLANYLEYPEGKLEQQCFENILYYKDHITFTEHLLKGLSACCIDGNKDHANLELKPFFVRIKKFHSIEDECVSLDQTITYKPFKVILQIYELTKEDSFIEKASGTLCANANATAILSAYTAPEEKFSMTCFSTRHTASCHFNYVDESAIQYTGYLPQDMIGYSIFDFYHVEDMPLMKDIYGLVVKEHGTTFRSHPYRFKIQNGCYIILETEWSCFIDPWSHSLEFVMGQHRILKGPYDVDIFIPSKKEINFPEQVVKASQKIQMEIKVSLSEVDSNSVMGDISPYKDANSSISSDMLSPTVQQICLEGNINRFFASDPQTYLNESDESNKNEKFYEPSQSSNSGSGEISGSTSLSKCQRPSPTNSENCNTNNPQAGIDFSSDSGYGKNQGKNSSQGTSHEGLSKKILLKSSPIKKSKNTEMFESCQPLTEESLSAHNHINNKQFKHQRKSKPSLDKESWKNNLVQIKDSLKRKKGLNEQKQKRSITTQTMQKGEHLAGADQNGMPGPFQFSPANGAMPTPCFMPVMLMGGFPNMFNPQAFWPFGSPPSFPMNPPKPTSEKMEFPNNPNAFAGYTQPTTSKFINHENFNQMSGYQNFCSFPSMNLIAENQKCAPKQVTRGKCKNLNMMNFTGSDGNQSQQNISDSTESVEPVEHFSSSSFTRTSSLESSNHKKEEMDCGKDNPLPKSSSEKVELTSELSLRYQMAIPSLEDTLKKDREALYTMEQPKLVREQFRLLKEESEVRKKHKVEGEDFSVTEDVMLDLPTKNTVYDELEKKEEYLWHLASYVNINQKSTTYEI